MDSKTICELFNYKCLENGQMMLFPDYDLILRSNPYKNLPLDLETKRKIIAHWWLNVYQPTAPSEKYPFEVYASYDSNCVFKYFYTRGSYWVTTLQASVSVKAEKSSSIEEMISECNIWLPDIKPEFDSKVGQNFKKIKIFEHTLSEYGSYSLHFYEQGSIQIFLNSRSNQSFNDMASCFEYLIKYHYYE